MGLPGKHSFGKLEKTDDFMVTFIEKKVPEDRANFLKDLLEFNGLEVILHPLKRKTEEDPQLYTVAVTDLTFNPVIAVYQRKLKTKDGRRVTPDFWDQQAENTNPHYYT